jgi:hypothetical protein
VQEFEEVVSHICCKFPTSLCSYSSIDKYLFPVIHSSLIYIKLVNGVSGQIRDSNRIMRFCSGIFYYQN